MYHSKFINIQVSLSFFTLECFFCVCLYVCIAVIVFIVAVVVSGYLAFLNVCPVYVYVISISKLSCKGAYIVEFVDYL